MQSVSTYKELASLVAAANQRSAGDVEEAHRLSAALPFGVLVRVDILCHLHVPLRRAHVLAEGDDVDVCFTQIFERLLHFCVRLATAQHDACLGDKLWLRRFCVPQHRETLTVLGPPIANHWRRTFNSLDVVRVHIHPARRDLLDAIGIAAKVRHQCLHQDLGCFELYLRDCLGNVRSATIHKIVAVDGREHDVP